MTIHRTSSQKSMFNSGRDYSVDIVRCVSCFMVVAGHMFAFLLPKYGYSAMIAGSVTYYIAIVLRCVFTSATDIFLMISGIFFLSPERKVSARKVWGKNVLKMALAYVL